MSVAQLRNEEVISLHQVVTFFWRCKFVITFVTGIFAIVSVMWVSDLADEYKAEATLVQNQNQSSGNISGVMGQLGGLASLAGVDVGGNTGTDVNVALEIVQSRPFVQKFIEENNLLPFLLAVNGWEKETNKLIFTKEIYNPDIKKWTRTAPKNKNIIPTSWEGYQAFMDRLTIEHDVKSGIISISFEYYSPFLAKEVTEKLVSNVNQYMREETLKELELSIEYLTNESVNTNVAELKSVFYKLIEEQTKQLMLARIKDEFVFKTVAPALVAEDKSKPNRAFLCVLITFVGFILSLFISAVYYSVRFKA